MSTQQRPARARNPPPDREAPTNDAARLRQAGKEREKESAKKRSHTQDPNSDVQRAPKQARLNFARKRTSHAFCLLCLLCSALNTYNMLFFGFCSVHFVRQVHARSTACHIIGRFDERCRTLSTLHCRFNASCCSRECEAALRRCGSLRCHYAHSHELVAFRLDLGESLCDSHTHTSHIHTCFSGLCKSQHKLPTTLAWPSRRIRAFGRGGGGRVSSAGRSE